MCDVETQASKYFGSLNPLARKIQQSYEQLIRKHDDWDDLTPEQQEELFDAHIIDREIRSKYESQSTVTESTEPCRCFPKLQIDAGEKIVVDFDNEDSQQDLSLLDEDLAQPSTEKPAKKSHTPDREMRTANFAFKPEKSIWDSPFLVAEKGLGKPDLFDSDELFKLTGGFPSTAMGGADSQEMLPSPTKTAEDSKLLASPHHENHSFQLDEPEDASLPVGSCSTVSSARTLNTTNSREDFSSHDSLDGLSSSEFKKKEKHGSSQKWRAPSKKELKIEAEQALITDDLMVAVGSEVEANQGQVSPVYIAEPGESFTDGAAFAYPATEANATEAVDVITMQPLGQVTENKEATKTTVMNTGFDFLDNW